MWNVFNFKITKNSVNYYSYSHWKGHIIRLLLLDHTVAYVTDYYTCGMNLFCEIINAWKRYFSINIALTFLKYEVRIYKDVFVIA